MPEKSSWDTVFPAHPPNYAENMFTKNALREADFLLEELSLLPGGSILDVGCGTRSHAIDRLGLSFSVRM